MQPAATFPKDKRSAPERGEKQKGSNIDAVTGLEASPHSPLTGFTLVYMFCNDSDTLNVTLFLTHCESVLLTFCYTVLEEELLLSK